MVTNCAAWGLGVALSTKAAQVAPHLLRAHGALTQRFSGCPGNRVLEQKPLIGSNTCTAVCALEPPLTSGRELWITAPGVDAVTYNRAALKTTCPQ
jgi:hypothetical protein